jgi:two-component system, NtrC family, nitrogen regulation sensor histidine kinase NtrY
MVYRNFRYNIIFRISLIIVLILVIFYALFRTSWVITTSLLIMLFIFQVYELISYVDKVNFDFSRFLKAIRYRDFSQTFVSDGRGRSFNELRDSFNLIIEEFRKISREKEIHFHYLRTVIEHINTGLISFDSSGEVELINRAAKEMLRVEYLRNVRSLEKFSSVLYSRILHLKPGEDELVEVAAGNDVLQISLKVSELKIGEKEYRIVSLHNIKNELEGKEIEAWQKLIRVLTHEIMNSVTPITSLTSTSLKLLQDEEGKPNNVISGEEAEDIYNALNTIEKRSRGLLHFVDVYRSLTLITEPKKQEVKVAELFERIEKLFRNDLLNRKIRLGINLGREDLSVLADPELTEQVLINLLINAVEAVDQISDPLIELNAFEEGDKVLIQVSDNGSGIPPEIKDKIFVPFFTTKKKGSGIGLSLSRQIMRLHGGSISARPGKKAGTVFTLKFKAMTNNP